MNLKTFFVLLVLMVSMLSLKVCAAQAQETKAPAKATKTQVQPTKFSQTVTTLKTQLADIALKKVGQQQAQATIEKEQAQLTQKSDSLYAAAKLILKQAYDKEVEALQAQDQALKASRDKLDQEYQDALKAVDEAKGIKK